MKKKTPLIPKVKFFKNSIFSHQDSRRGLIGLAGNLKFVNDSKQIKIINRDKTQISQILFFDYLILFKAWSLQVQP